MKTILPNAINTIDEAKQFLNELYKNKEAYHPEDDAHDVIWNSVPKEEWPNPIECDQLNKLMDDIYGLKGNEDHMNMELDPCGYLMDLDAEQESN